MNIDVKELVGGDGSLRRYRAYEPTGRASDHFSGYLNLAEKLPLTKQVSPNSKPEKSSLVSLGTLSKATPTVSELLIQHPTFGRSCWEIVFSSINASKPYTSIPDNTEIFIDPITRELCWGDDVPKDTAGTTVAASISDNGSAAPVSTETQTLDSVVSSYIGRPYNDVDCYELIVEGLEQLGIRYHGKGGLAEYLTGKARKEGLPINTYLTGEGLVQLSGSILYSKELKTVSNPDAEARKVFDELRNHLENGSVLSFSTQTSGHTGVISRENDTWTYINSGYQNNTVGGGLRKKAVGEETLYGEIRGWLKQAKRRNEAISITLGRFDDKKLSAFKHERVSVKA